MRNVKKYFWQDILISIGMINKNIIMKRMKVTVKSITLSLLFLTGTVLIYAQSPKTDKGVLSTTFGIKGGLNLTNLYVNDVNDENSKLGFQAGVFLKAPITGMFSIQPELIYSLKGSELTYDNLFATGKASFNLYYIELPVMAVINLGNNFNIHAGPYFSYLAGVTIKNKSTNSNYNFEREINKDNFEEFDYGVAGGIGFDAKKVGLGLRYSYGLKEVGKEKQVFGVPYSFNNGKNSVLQLYLTFGL